jgi:hypothetical protein
MDNVNGSDVQICGLENNALTDGGNGGGDGARPGFAARL